MSMHRLPLSFFLLSRCLYSVQSDESCEGLLSWGIVDADALPGKHRVLLQVANDGHLIPRLNETGEVAEVNETGQRDRSQLILTTTTSPQRIPNKEPRIAEPLEDVHMSIPSLTLPSTWTFTSTPFRISVPPGATSQPEPHNPHENYWYWAWTRPANGNFESGTHGQIPAHWQRFASFGTTGLISTTQARSGSSSVWFSGPGWELIETGGHASEKMMVTAGSEYSLTFWARSTAANQNVQTMFVVYTDPDNSNHTRTLSVEEGAPKKIHYITAENIWQKFTHVFKAQEWTNEVRMNIGPHGTRGSVWIDDILFSREVAKTKGLEAEDDEPWNNDDVFFQDQSESQERDP